MEVGQCGGIGDGILQGADLVHQADVQGIGSHPDSALGNFVHTGGFQVPSLGHQVHKTLIDILHRSLHKADFIAVEGAHQGKHVTVLVGTHGLYPHANLFGDVGELGEHGEYADGAGDGGGIGINLLASVGNPVSAGSGIIAERGHQRLLLLKKIQRGTDFFRRRYAAAGRVHAEHDGLHAFVLPDLVDNLYETVSGHVAVVFLPVHDVTIGIQDSHIAATGKSGRAAGHIIGEGDEHQLLAVIHPGQGAESSDQVLMVDQFVHQAGLQVILRQIEGKIVHQGVEIFQGQPTGLGNGTAHFLPGRIHHHLILFPVFGGSGGFDEHFSGALVFAVTDQLHVHAQLIQYILQENHLGGDAYQLGCAAVMGTHINLVGHRGEVEGSVGGVLHVCHHGFSAFSEGRKGGAEFLGVGHPQGSLVGTEKNVLDAGILGRGADGYHGIAEPYEGSHIETHRHHIGGRCVLALLSHHEGAHIQIQHPVFGKGRLTQPSHGADEENHQKQEADNPEDKIAADHGKHSLDKIFHRKGI